jgi:hypothetical protein
VCVCVCVCVTVCVFHAAESERWGGAFYFAMLCWAGMLVFRAWYDVGGSEGAG